MTKAEKILYRINRVARKLASPDQPGRPITHIVSQCHWFVARFQLQEQVEQLQEAIAMLDELDQGGCMLDSAPLRHVCSNGVVQIPDDGFADGGEPYTEEELEIGNTEMIPTETLDSAPPRYVRSIHWQEQKKYGGEPYTEEELITMTKIIIKNEAGAILAMLFVANDEVIIKECNGVKVIVEK